MKTADIVLSLCGHDAGSYLFVLSTDEHYVLVADGKRRKLESPKRKKRKHVQLVLESDARVAQKMRSGEKFTNSELRRALADFLSARQELEEGQYGER